MNSVSYMDGAMFAGNRSELYAFLDYIKRVTGDKSWVTQYGSERETGHQGVSDVRECD